MLQLTELCVCFLVFFFPTCPGSSLCCVGFLQLQRAVSSLVVHRLGCCATFRTLPDQGLSLCPPALAGGLPSTVPPGKPLTGVWFAFAWGFLTEAPGRMVPQRVGGQGSCTELREALGGEVEMGILSHEGLG